MHKYKCAYCSRAFWHAYPCIPTKKHKHTHTHTHVYWSFWHAYPCILKHTHTHTCICLFDTHALAYLQTHTHTHTCVCHFDTHTHATYKKTHSHTGVLVTRIWRAHSIHTKLRESPACKGLFAPQALRSRPESCLVFLNRMHSHLLFGVDGLAAKAQITWKDSRMEIVTLVPCDFENVTLLPYIRVCKYWLG
jgi:hypothetical protein